MDGTTAVFTIFAERSFWFDVHGVTGLLYWYAMYPFHNWVFKGMLAGIAKAVGKPVIQGPDRFTPKVPHACGFDPRNP